MRGALLKKIPTLFCILLLFLAFSSCEKQVPVAGNESSATLGATAPDFILKDIEGREVRLSGFRGKVVLIEFWATWCPPCKATVPELKALYNRYGDKGLVVLGIAVDEDAAAAPKLLNFSREQGINYTTVLGTEAVERAYHVSSIPMMYLIDKQGKIRSSYMGYMDNFEARMSGEIEGIL